MLLGTNCRGVGCFTGARSSSAQSTQTVDRSASESYDQIVDVPTPQIQDEIPEVFQSTFPQERISERISIETNRRGWIRCFSMERRNCEVGAPRGSFDMELGASSVYVFFTQTSESTSACFCVWQTATFATSSDVSRKSFPAEVPFSLWSRRLWPIPEFSGFSRDEKVQKTPREVDFIRGESSSNVPWRGSFALAESSRTPSHMMSDRQPTLWQSYLKVRRVRLRKQRHRY